MCNTICSKSNGFPGFTLKTEPWSTLMPVRMKLCQSKQADLLFSASLGVAWKQERTFSWFCLERFLLWHRRMYWCIYDVNSDGAAFIFGINCPCVKPVQKVFFLDFVLQHSRVLVLLIKVLWWTFLIPPPQLLNKCLICGRNIGAVNRHHIIHLVSVSWKWKDRNGTKNVT